MNRARSACASAFVALVLGLGTWAAPAAAHGGDGIVSVDAAHPTASGVHFVVKVVWENDLDPVEDATVTMTATTPGGETRDPVPMEVLSPADGTYGGDVQLDEAGTWQFEFTSTDPPGSASDSYEHEPEPATTEAPTTTEAAEATEPEVSANSDAELTVADEGSDSDDGPPLALVAGAFAVLAAVVAGIFWLVVRRTGLGGDTAGAAGSGGDPDSPGDTGDAGSGGEPGSADDGGGDGE